jgi:hypothetical protein
MHQRVSTFAPIPAETERVATTVIGGAIDVHRELGPGFLHLRTTGLRLGLLLNFNCSTLREGIQRIVV